MPSPHDTEGTVDPAAPAHRNRAHYLYIAVVVAVALGVLVGFLAPGFAKQLAPLGTGFVSLIKMLISPIIFCTIVLGIGSVAKAAKVGKVGLLALTYFMIMSTVALAIGLVVGNLLHPGSGLHLDPAAAAKAHASAAGGEAATSWMRSSTRKTTDRRPSTDPAIRWADRPLSSPGGSANGSGCSGTCDMGPM